MKSPFLHSFARGVAVLLLLSSAGTISTRAAELSRLNGRWRWTFTMPDGVETRPLVKLRYDGRTLTGSARYRHATETPITSAKFDGQLISFQVVRQANDRRVVTRYSGTLNGDVIQGKIQSNWNGEVQSYPWEARRLPDTPEGTWTWTKTIGDKEVEITMKAKLDADKVTGKVSPRKRGGWDIQQGRFHKDGRLTFELEGKIGTVEFTSRFEGVIVGDLLQGHEFVEVGGTKTKETWEATRAD